MSDISGDWPSVTDDDGSGKTGTIVNLANIWNVIKTAINNQVFSTANPSLKPKDTIDEVVNARGSKTTLDARLDVALNEDGTPKPVTGQASEAQVSAQQGSQSLIRNGNMELWSDGVAAAPDGWALSGAGAAVAKAGPAQADTTDLGVGTYCAKITSGGGAIAKLTDAVVTGALFASIRNIKSRKFQLIARGKASAANVLRIVVDDGVTTTASTYHAGDGAEAMLTVTHTLSSSATKLDVYAEVAAGGNIAYAGGFVGLFSDLGMTAWPPWADPLKRLPLEQPPKFNFVGGATPLLASPSSSVDRSAAGLTNTGSGETDLNSKLIPKNTVLTDGQGFRVTFSYTAAANANVKTIRIYFGAGVVTLRSVADNGIPIFITLYMVRRSSSNLRVDGIVVSVNGTLAGVVPTAMTGLDFTVDNTLKITGQGTATADITMLFWLLELLPP